MSLMEPETIKEFLTSHDTFCDLDRVNIIRCENINELKRLNDMGTAGLPYVYEWALVNLEKHKVFPVFVNICYDQKHGIILNNISTEQPDNNLLRVITYTELDRMSNMKLNGMFERMNEEYQIKEPDDTHFERNRKNMTNYEYIKSLTPEQLALCLAQIEDGNDWFWRCKDYLSWLSEETQLDYSDVKKYYK